MTKKFLLMCLALLLVFQGAASAKKNSGLPENERIRVAVEVVDTSRHRDELQTAPLLENFLAAKLFEKQLVNVVDAKNFDGDVDISSAANFGELMVFDAFELPPAVDTPKDFDQARYQSLGAAYVVRCEVLALGLTKVPNELIGTVTGVLGGGLSLGGSGNSKRDKTLRRIGTGIGLLGFGGMLDVTKRTALNTVVNMQFIDVASGKVLWQENFTGQAIKHHSGGKKFSDAWTRAFSESVEDSAKLIAKRVNKYVDQVVVKGKSDKNFLPKNFSLGGLNSGKLF